MEELLIIIGYIVFFAILAGVIASKLKQPSVIVLLLIGSIVGPNALGLIKNVELINGAAELGAILLLFLIGIEFSVSKIFATGVRALIITIIKIAIVFFFGYETALLLGFGEIVALYIGVMLSISSTAIFIKVIEDRKLARSEEVPLLISILILEDIFAVFALTFFSTLKDTAIITVGVMLNKFGLALVIISLSYLISLKLFRRILQWLVKNTTEDTFTFIAIGICIGFSILAASVKLSPSIGAFLAGSLVAYFPEARKFQDTLHSFSLTFVALFFLSLGMLIEFGAIWKNFFLIALLLVVNVVSKFISVAGGTFFVAKFSRKQAIFSGLVFTSVGEFSLLIARESSGIAPNLDLISITAAVIFFSAVIMSVLISYSEEIGGYISRKSGHGLKHKLYDIAGRISRIPAAFESDGWLYSKFRGKKKNLVLGFFMVMVELALVFLLWEIFQNYVAHLIKNKLLQGFLLVAGIILVIYPITLFFRNFKGLLDMLVDSFVEVDFYQQIDSKLSRRIGNYFIFGSVCILLGMIMPFVFSLIRLPKIFNAAAVISIITGILFIWGGVRKVKRRVFSEVTKIKKKIWK